MGHGIWPLVDLTVRTPTLELRYPDDELLFALADLARSPIHPPEMMPFSMPWSDASPEERARSTLQYHWKCRGGWDAADWHCPMVAVVDGTVVGTQEVFARSFASTRTASTGSWLGMDHQGQGYGKEMRAAVLHLAFEGLGAERCESGAFEDNAASLGVSRRLGYVDNGDEVHVRRDTVGRIVRLVLHRSAWSRRDDITISGLDGCRTMFGA
jgi:RimJ/RimL family protein N-acetyltransferase